MKEIIACPFIPISWKISSHRGAQAAIYADQIRSTGVDLDINWSGKIRDYDRYDRLWFYHGNDYTGSGVNLYGDVISYPYSWNVLALFSYRGPVTSLYFDMPRYDLAIQKKIASCRARGKGDQILRDFLDLDMDNIRRMCTTAETVRFPTVTDKLVVGDSHAICMYRPGWTVHSVPYKTLHGALEIGLQKLVEEVAPVYQFKEIEFYFGNIDVRHHIFRQDHPYAAIMGLAQRYADQVNDFHKFGIRPSVYELLPIEDESRKLPTTGLYKGKPFYGSWGERNDARLAFRNYLRNRVYLKE